MTEVERRMRMQSKIAGYVFIVLFSIFASFFLVAAFVLHGDALNGKEVAGRYYLYGVGPGQSVKGFFEVSEPVYRFSQVHAIAFTVSVPLLLIVGWFKGRLDERIRKCETGNGGA